MLVIQLLRGKFNIDTFILRTKDVGANDLFHRKQSRTRDLDVVAELAMSEAAAGESINDAVGIAQFIVEKWSQKSLGKSIPNVIDLLAHLIPDVRNALSGDRVVKHHINDRAPGSGVAGNKLQLRNLFQFLFETFSNLPARLFDRSARPMRLHNHQLVWKRRIFAAAKLQVRPHARDDAYDHEKRDEHAIVDRPLGKIEIQ